MEIAARYYDGRTSRMIEVRLLFSADGFLRLAGEGVSAEYPLGDLRIDTRVGNTPRCILFPEGGKCEVADNDALDQALSGCAEPNPGESVHRLENNPVYVLLAVVLTVGFCWGMVEKGIPWLAARAAYALPQDVDRALGQGTLDALDRAFFSDSELPPDRRVRLRARFRDMVAGLEDGEQYRLEFRGGEKMGANALALPSGLVVVTDELVALSENDDEVIAVLAHEVGHLVHRHSLRMVMQDSALTLVFAAVTGDPFSSSTLAAALPTILVHASYSREFETEADDYAYAWMSRNRVPHHAFADILMRLDAEDGSSELQHFLSSHPATGERIGRFRDPSDQETQ